MNSIREMIFSPWPFMRIARLVIGLFLAVNSVMMHDSLSGLLSAIFIFQAVTNTGCCGSSCAIPVRRGQDPKQDEKPLEPRAGGL